MRPALPLMIAAAQVELERQKQISPALSGQFLRGIGMILELVARDWDSITPDTVARITELQALLARGAAVAPPPLAAALSAAIDDVDVSVHLRLSQLEAIYDRLTEAMIALQAWLEGIGDPSAVDLARDLDAHLAKAVARRILTGSNPW